MTAHGGGGTGGLVVELWDLDKALVEQWEDVFADIDEVIPRHGSILGRRGDAIVSPANSFGFMDGGLDLRYSQHFGWEVEKALRQRLLAEHDGELPVGMALVVPMAHDDVKYLISAPTMRVPSPVEHTVNAYLAFRAVLRAVRAFNADAGPVSISRVLCPGLGTGEGRMAPRRCALQMREAWEVCVEGRRLSHGGLAGGVRQHMRLLGESFDDAAE